MTVDPSITLPLHLLREEVRESVSDTIVEITLKEYWFLNKNDSFGTFRTLTMTSNRLPVKQLTVNGPLLIVKIPTSGLVWPKH